jgi:hypothetical protein
MRVFAIRRDTSGTISIHYDFGVLESYTSGAVGRKPWPQATLDHCSILARCKISISAIGGLPLTITMAAS